MAFGSALKGPRKAGRLPLLVATAHAGFRVFDYRVRELFERADIVSEGACKPAAEYASEPSVAAASLGQATDGRSYFGTTDIVLDPELDPSTALVPPELLVRIFAWDPHVRVRALRIACREARVRANAHLDRVRTEIVVSRASAGINIHIDLEARVVSTHARSLSAPRAFDPALGKSAKAPQTRGAL